jgi:hypothetical protein
MRSLIPVPILAVSLACVAADKPGSEDLEALPRFQQSEIVDFRNAEQQERRYPMGAIRRIGGQLRFEGEVLANGELRSLTYRIPTEYRATEAFEYARQTLISEGAQMLYWCVARGCGSSSLWANDVFGRSSLYGPDEGQAYALMRVQDESEDTLYALYAITRGTRQAFLQVEQFTPASSLGKLLPTPSTLLRQLREDNNATLPENLGAVDSEWLSVLSGALKTDSSLRVVLNGEKAGEWRAALIEQGIRQNRIEVDETGADQASLQVTVIR